MSLSNNFPTIAPSLNLDFANVKALDPRITFVRTTTGVFYDGKTTAKAEENLLINSQALAAASWTSFRLVTTNNNGTAPDGTSTATTIIQQAGQTSGGQVNLTGSVSAVQQQYVVSVFAKPNGKNFLAFAENLSDGTVRTTWFDLQNGTIGTTNANHTATITAQAQGYYRCTISFTPNAARTGTPVFRLADTDNSTTVADDGNGLFLWGAQLEQRSAVTAYTPTTTQPITNYIPQLLTAAAGQARFDHNPITGESLGLLVEEQRTNQLQRSDDFANAYWTKTRSSITSNTIVAPDGTLTGDKLVEDTTATNTHDTYAGNYSASSTTITVSVYAKAGERPRLLLEISNFLNGSASAIFNLTTGATSNAGSTTADYTSVSSSIQSVGNGWYRCVLTATKGTANSNNYFVINLDNGTTRSYTGDGYSGAFLWGAELEVGAFPTSYIPTVAATVTRNADAASMTGTNFSSWYRADEGTLYGETQITYQPGTNPLIVGLEENLVSNTQITMFLAGGSPNYRASIRENLVESFLQNVVSAANILDVNKWAIAYKENDSNSWGRASNTTDTTVRVPPAINSLNFGASGQQVKYVRKIAYYPSRLSNAQLQALTTV